MKVKKISKSRRRLLQLTGTTTLGAALLPLKSAEAGKANGPGRQPDPAKTNGAHDFFNPQQRQLVEELTETIIPANEHSGGAKAAKVVDYIDRILRESLDEELRKTWVEGLKLIEVMSERACGSSFVQANPEQRAAVLQVLSDSVEMTELPEVRFFNQLKRLTIDGYYTSKIGILEELEYKGNRILDEFVGCQDSQT
jgi:gluconate 2-dehydrogenase gamma chain